jgi:hypothetical protein
VDDRDARGPRAEANLRAALAAGLANPTFDAVVGHGTRRYFMGSVETVETAPIFVGDTDDPVLCGGPGETVTVTNERYAEVSFFELNVRGDAPPDCSPVARTEARPVDVWYGSAFDGKKKVRDAVRLTDHIAFELAVKLARDPTVDPRARHVGPFTVRNVRSRRPPARREAPPPLPGTKARTDDDADDGPRGAPAVGDPDHVTPHRTSRGNRRRTAIRGRTAAGGHGFSGLSSTCGTLTRRTCARPISLRGNTHPAVFGWQRSALSSAAPAAAPATRPAARG